MKKNLLHYGLQRSGTNFLENLLLKNFKVNVLNSNEDRAHPLQKHFRLYDEKQYVPEPQYSNDLSFEHFNEYLDSLELTMKIDGVIVISKDPYSWLLSYEKWCANCKWPETNYHYSIEYNLFYGKWLEFGKQDARIHFLRYIDLLSDPKKELEIIKDKFQLNSNLLTQLTGIKANFKKVAHSKSFSSSQEAYYKNKVFLEKYTDTQLDIINSNIDSTVLEALGYERISKK